VDLHLQTLSFNHHLQMVSFNLHFKGLTFNLHFKGLTFNLHLKGLTLHHHLEALCLLVQQRKRFQSGVRGLEKVSEKHACTIIMVSFGLD
jgi:hypothetical protein